MLAGKQLEKIFNSTNFNDMGSLRYLYKHIENKGIFDKLKEMGLEVKEYTAADSNEIASVTKLACQNSDVLYVPTDNTMASSAKTIDNIAKPAGVPIIAGEEGICSGCGIATLSISYYDIGYKAGEMAYDILVNGKDPATMDIEFVPEDKLTKEYDAARCKALGLKVVDGYKAIES